MEQTFVRSILRTYAAPDIDSKSIILWTVAFIQKPIIPLPGRSVFQKGDILAFTSGIVTGFLRSNTNQLNLALKYHAQEGNQKWVSLLLWAGGDGHAHLPEICDAPNPDEDTSAIENACGRGFVEIVDKIGLDPKRDNLQRMFETACLLG